MKRLLKLGQRIVRDPIGRALTLDALPPADTVRWSPRRKHTVVIAVRNGLLSLDEACERYKLSLDEFMYWQRSIEKNGTKGLRVRNIYEDRHG